MGFCSNCGNKLNDHDNFCSSCGTIVDKQKTTDTSKWQVGKPVVWGGNHIVFEMMPCPAGTFIMGSKAEDNSDEKEHSVTISKPFLIGKYEVSYKLYQTVCNLFGKRTVSFAEIQNAPQPAEKQGWPMPAVSWYDASRFCKNLNALTEGHRPKGYVFDLPTEAQWEYACKAGTTSDFNNGFDWHEDERGKCSALNLVGWYCENSGENTHKVGKKAPNAWGIYDMHGNLCEWCRDWYGDYPNGSVTDPTGVSSGVERVLRGGSLFHSSRSCRSAYRNGCDPLCDNRSIGFRLALVPKGSKSNMSNSQQSQTESKNDLSSLGKVLSLELNAISKYLPPEWKELTTVGQWKTKINDFLNAKLSHNCLDFDTPYHYDYSYNCLDIGTPHHYDYSYGSALFLNDEPCYFVSSSQIYSFEGKATTMPDIDDIMSLTVPYVTIDNGYNFNFYEDLMCVSDDKEIKSKYLGQHGEFNFPYLNDYNAYAEFKNDLKTILQKKWEHVRFPVVAVTGNEIEDLAIIYAMLVHMYDHGFLLVFYSDEGNEMIIS